MMRYLILSALIAAILHVTSCQTPTVLGPVETKTNFPLILTNHFQEKAPSKLAKLVAAHVSYVPDPQGIWQQPAFTYHIRMGDCEDFSLLLMAELLSKGIDCRIVVGRSSRLIPHAWVYCLGLYIEATDGTVLIPETSGYTEQYRLKYVKGRLHVEEPVQYD